MRDWIGSFAVVFCVLTAGCGGGSGGGGGGTPAPTVTAVSVTLAPASITTAQTSQATATVSGTGAYDSAVAWSVSPTSSGSISSAGVFTPAIAGTATITATSVQNTSVSGSALVTVTSTTTVTVAPSSPTVTIGKTQQFTASINGSASTAVTWSVVAVAPSGWTGSAGSINSSGLYESPYPAPTQVTVTATSTADTSASGSVTAMLAAPATVAGPVLTVDVGNQLHSISPYIYGMNGYLLDTTSAQTANTSLVRWGGDGTSRYNYQNGITNAASDYFFENVTAGLMLPNPTGNTPFSGTTNSFVAAANGMGISVLGTVPVLGWVANGSTTVCSYPESTYPGQQSYSPSGCGNGVYPQGTQGCTSSNGCNIVIPANQQATFAAVTSIAEPPPTPPGAGANTQAWAQATWAGGWVSSIVTASGYGNGASGKGVAFWDLDNEPAWWDAVHRDVHPSPSTYDEVTQGGIGTALAIKTIDPTAKVNGPVIDNWWNYFYSKKDMENGWGTGPCYQPWDNPTDRQAHGGVAMIPYYLQQMKQASTTYGMRLLDYLDIHGYFAASYNGSSVSSLAAGDTGEQMVRMDSVRALWDPTYTNTSYPQPNYLTDANYYNPANNNNQCNVPLQSPQAIPMMHQWVSGVGPLGDPNNNYPATMTAIDEYNWGGLASINGAVTQADVLGVFGQYGLDLATLWPTTNYTAQGPGNYAFAMYRNYDGNKSTFGNMALASCSTTTALAGACTPISSTYVANPAMESGQGQLSAYAALRTSDNSVTVMVINKTYGSLTSTLSLLNMSATGSAKVYQYSNANLTAIQTLPNATVTPPSAGGTTSTLSYTFPAQSITLFVIPQ